MPARTSRPTHRALHLLTALVLGAALLPSPGAQAQQGYPNQGWDSNTPAKRQAMLGARLRGTASGVLIEQVLRGSAAQEAGLKPGDVILRFGDSGVRSVSDLQGLLRAREPGDVITVRVSRFGQESTVTVVLGSAPTTAAAPRPATTSPTTSAKNSMGQQVPGFALERVGTTGQSISSLAELRGKPTIIMFWATWCPACKRMLPALESLKATQGSTVHVLAISGESEAAIRRYQDKTSWDNVTMVRDASYRSQRHFGVRAIPQIVVLDSQHRVRKVFTGYVAQSTLEKVLANVR